MSTHISREQARRLVDEGWLFIEEPSLGANFDELVAAYERLRTDPRAEMFRVTAREEFGEDGRSDLGLLDQRKGEKKEDLTPYEIAEGRTHYDQTKTSLHYNDRLPGYLLEQGAPVQRHAWLFQELKRVRELSFLLGLNLLKAVDEVEPGYDLTRALWCGEGDSKTRLVRYACDSTANIAQGHLDASDLSIQIRSSRAGMWLADKNSRIRSKLGDEKPRTVLAFWGRKMRARTRGKFFAPPHGAIDTLPQAGSPRHTLVTFLHGRERRKDRQWGEENPHKFDEEIFDFMRRADANRSLATAA